MDDYGDIRDVVADVLQNAGFIVRTAADGLEALIAAYEMRPMVILMEVSMPVLDGVEATRLIKACAVPRDARSLRTPGILGSRSLQPRMLFAAVLTKPAAPEALSQLCDTRLRSENELTGSEHRRCPQRAAADLGRTRSVVG